MALSQKLVDPPSGVAQYVREKQQKRFTCIKTLSSFCIIRTLTVSVCQRRFHIKSMLEKERKKQHVDYCYMSRELECTEEKVFDPFSCPSATERSRSYDHKFFFSFDHAARRIPGQGPRHLPPGIRAEAPIRAGPAIPGHPRGESHHFLHFQDGMSATCFWNDSHVAFIKQTPTCQGKEEDGRPPGERPYLVLLKENIPNWFQYVDTWRTIILSLGR